MWPKLSMLTFFMIQVIVQEIRLAIFFKNSLFDDTDIVKNSDWSKHICRNVVICGIDNSSSFHTDNSKNSFLKSGEVPIDNVNDNARAADKRFSINFTKQRQNFAWVYIIMVIVVIY